MKKFEETVLERLFEIQKIVDGTLNQKENFTVKTEGAEGTTYTHDRENYLQLGLEVLGEQLQFLIEDIEERTERKRNFKIMK